MNNPSFDSFRNRFSNKAHMSGLDFFPLVADIEEMNNEINANEIAIAAIIAGDVFDSVTAAALVALRTAGTLVPGRAYLINDLAEPLIVYALSTTKLSFWAYSPTYPQDRIVYNTSDALSANWKIVYREDTINRNIFSGTDADYRTLATLGASCTNITVVNWTAGTLSIGASCSNLYIDKGVATGNITIAASTTNKRVEAGFSNFESASIDVNGLATIDLSSYQHCGIINLISSSDSDTEQIDTISNATGNFPITFVSTDTLTINWRDLGISGGNLKLESSPTTTLGDRHDFIVFEKDGANMNLVNVRNYLPILVSP